jgi:hypothetical protein
MAALAAVRPQVQLLPGTVIAANTMPAAIGDAIPGNQSMRARASAAMVAMPRASAVSTASSATRRPRARSR